MDVTWAMLWGGSRSTKPSVFPCKVAAAGDERYLLCAAGAAGVVVVHVCVVLCLYAFLESVLADRSVLAA